MPLELNAQSDKTVLFSGTKFITSLLGEKLISEMSVTSDKILSLNGNKKIDVISTTSDKTVILYGEKNINELTGLKTIDSLNGTKNTLPLLGDDPDGFWHILISATFIDIDTTLITSDRD